MAMYCLTATGQNNQGKSKGKKSNGLISFITEKIVDLIYSDLKSTKDKNIYHGILTTCANYCQAGNYYHTEGAVESAVT